MAEKSKIYTKGGDSGETSLAGGQRVQKDDVAVEAYGTIDELNANVGWLMDYLGPTVDQNVLQGVQNRLFRIGGYLATPDSMFLAKESQLISQEAILEIELRIDFLDAQLPVLKQFIMPGGGRLASVIHITRTVCRRAERRVVALSHLSSVDPLVLRYLNRLSDYFFVLARHYSIKANREEKIWDKDCK